MQHPIRKTYVSTIDAHEDWYMVRPPARGTAWLVNLHGHGAHGDQIFTRPDIRDGWLPEVEKLGLGILAPNLRDNAWMCPEAVTNLHELIGTIRDEYGAERFLLVSGSMGGTGSLIYAVRHPEDVDAVAALCPSTDIAAYHAWCGTSSNGVIREIRRAVETSYGGTPASAPGRFGPHRVTEHHGRLTMPVYVSHGTDDAAIPVAQSRRLFNLMSAAGQDVTYDEIPGGDHDAPLHDGRVWDWIRTLLT